jgi:hypothetical protein
MFEEAGSYIERRIGNVHLYMLAPSYQADQPFESVFGESRRVRQRTGERQPVMSRVCHVGPVPKSGNPRAAAQRPFQSAHCTGHPVMY